MCDSFFFSINRSLSQSFSVTFGECKGGKRRSAFSRWVDGNVRIFRRGHLSPIITNRLDGITHIAGGKRNWKGKGKENRRWGSAAGGGKRRRRIVANMFIGRGKKNCSFLWRRSTKSATWDGGYQATSTAVAMLSFRSSFCHFARRLLASLLCKAANSVSIAVAQGAQSPRCERTFSFWSLSAWRSCSWPYKFCFCAQQAYFRFTRSGV